MVVHNSHFYFESVWFQWQRIVVGFLIKILEDQKQVPENHMRHIVSKRLWSTVSKAFLRSMNVHCVFVVLEFQS